MQWLTMSNTEHQRIREDMAKLKQAIAISLSRGTGRNYLKVPLMVFHIPEREVSNWNASLYETHSVKFFQCEAR